MNQEQIQQYEYLWKRTDPNWVLLGDPDSPGSYSVFNKLGSILLIENDEVNEEVCKRMRDAGCEVVEWPSVAEGLMRPVKPSNRP